ncbi:hypothetical protein [Ketobacter sp.]|uniref:hypothetical protein n=1 Tax=Ketobacter sp. TaxID=2083498 RepID=UPI000F15FFEA|nr:hypothetical protein [Ketobacter sp.]MEE2733701.1 hypothetical protein [Pseudomonadota bacterium]RLT96856.1 MAG: hypothetical protein D9N14_12550 [Ketobacter sp.]
MFRNKHIIVALIVAPILAVIGYLATDALVGEKPHKAEAGQSYSLVALPNCRYPSGHCTLKNAEFQVDVSVDQAGVNRMTLSLTAKHPLQGAKAALVENAQQPGDPVDLTATDNSAQHWTVDLSGDHTELSTLRLVVAAADAIYFGETGLTFIDYQTSFGKDFRHE